MQAALISLVAAGSVAAQHLTFLPAIPAVVAAVDPSDPEYTVCSAANALLEVCISSIGGSDAVQTADPTELVNCACCDSNTALAPAYSVCSSYLSEEAPSYSSEYSGGLPRKDRSWVLFSLKSSVWLSVLDLQHGCRVYRNFHWKQPPDSHLRLCSRQYCDHS